MRRLTLPLALLVLAVPAQASAAPATIAPRATDVTATGATSIHVTNATRHVLSGRATLTVAGRAVASRPVRLAKRRTTRIELRLKPAAVAALRDAGTQPATVTMRLRRARGPMTTARRTLTLRAASGPSAPAPSAPTPVQASPPATTTPGPAAPASNRWVGRMGTEGAYDDLELALVDGTFQLTKAPVLPVYCFETDGRPNDSAVSGELFDAPGPWTIGTDGEVVKEGVSVNVLLGRSPRSITYKVTGTTRTADRIAGTLGMSFFGVRTHVFYGHLVFVNCAGSQGFEAVPAT
jgi:hypothetical protein